MHHGSVPPTPRRTLTVLHGIGRSRSGESPVYMETWKPLDLVTERGLSPHLRTAHEGPMERRAGWVTGHARARVGGALVRLLREQRTETSSFPWCGRESMRKFMRKFMKSR